MGEPWWDGWIGALLAAAVTVGATIWWDGRVRRRERLEDAVSELAAATEALGAKCLEVIHADAGPSGLTDQFRNVAEKYLTAQGNAWRPVLFLIPARWVAPARFGLGLTFVTLSEWLIADSALEPKEKRVQYLNQVVEVCTTTRAVCRAWMYQPRRFWPRRDLSERILMDLREAQVRSSGDPS